MNYNLPYFRIDKRDFLRGNDSSEYLDDGGYSRSSYNANPFYKPGTFTNGPVFGTSVSEGLPNNGIVSWGYGRDGLQQQLMAVMANSDNDGYFYTVNVNGQFTQAGSPDTSNNYVAAKSSTVFYQSKFYTTSDSNITEHSSDLATVDTTWWTVTKGQSGLSNVSPHPQVVYGDIHYIADSRYIHQNDGGTISAQVFDLGSDWIITCMVVYNNLIYITAEPYHNVLSGFHGGAKMFTWQGYGSWIDEWDLDYRINAMKVFEGTLYMWTQNYMGYWNGATFKPLWALEGTNSVWNAGVTEVDKSMFFVDGRDLIRYGSPEFGGGKRFFRWDRVSGDFLSGVTGFYEKRLVGVRKVTASNTSWNMLITNVNNPSAGNCAVTFSPRRFRRKVRGRGVVVETESLTTGQSVQLFYTDDKGTTHEIGTFDTVGKTKYVKEIFNCDPTTTLAIQAYIGAGATVKNIDVYYEASELK